MTRAETLSVLDTLIAAWPHYRLTDATIDLWCQKFANTDRATAFRAAQLAIDNGTTFPTVAEMRSAVLAVRNRPKPYRPALEPGDREVSPDDAWARIAEMKARLRGEAS